jgi:hypothetical protein
MKIQTSSVLLHWPPTIALPTVLVQQILISIWPHLAIRLTGTVVDQQQIPVPDSQMNIPRKSTVSMAYLNQTTAMGSIVVSHVLGRKQLFRRT